MRSETLRKEKRMRRNNTIIGAILLFLMVFSMLAVYVNNPDNSNPNLVYNTYTFSVEDINGGQMVTTKVNGQKYAFYTLPVDAIKTVENLTGVAQMSSAQKIIFTKEPLEMGGQVSSEQLYFGALVMDLQATSGKIIVEGISKFDQFSDKKVYTCNDSLQTSLVVTLKKGTYSSMNITELTPNCYEITSDSMSILILRDYLIYKSLGIIN